jgi:excisionase family DNA binding protein
MRWLKVAEAAKEWAGGVSAKTMYAAIRARKLKAARIGAGRNVLVCEAFVDEWLTGSAFGSGDRDGLASAVSAERGVSARCGGKEAL